MDAALLDAVPVPLWLVDTTAGAGASIPGLEPDAHVVTANPAALALHGAGSVDELVGALDRVFPAAGRPALRAAWRVVVGGAARCEAETVIATLAGQEVPARVSLARCDASRAVLTVSSHAHRARVTDDIYLRLAESEERFRIMADDAPVMLWMTGTDGLCEFFNRGWLEFTGRALDDEIGSGWAEGVHPLDFQSCMLTFLTSFVARTGFRMEYRLRRHDGAWRWILDHGVPRTGPDGSFAGFIGSCIDITALKTLEQELDTRVRELGDRLREREVLLHEVHHRVKNNLQLITSLLRLQAREAADGKVSDALDECQGRIATIAAIHDGLYLSKDFARVAFGRYGRRLAIRIFQTASGQGNGHAPDQVALELDFADVELGVDQSIPCGLILNELITNALKHAFPDGRPGTVRVGCAVPSPSLVTLIVADDGVGLPAGVDVHDSPTLGLRLVSTLAGQLDGRVEIERDRGTVFRIHFEGGR